MRNNLIGLVLTVAGGVVTAGALYAFGVLGKAEEVTSQADIKTAVEAVLEARAAEDREAIAEVVAAEMLTPDGRHVTAVVQTLDREIGEIKGTVNGLDRTIDALIATRSGTGG